MLEAGLEALALLFTIERLSWLLFGVLIGIVVGILPGMGGPVGLAVILPFIYGMDQASGIALLMGAMAVTATSDTFPAVLIGVPGSASSQATVMDGYPLAKQGQAGRALGAAFTASMIGGLIGAVALFASIPIFRPLVATLQAPHLFMLVIFGVVVVGVLSRGAPLQGVLLGLLGFVLSVVGSAPSTGQTRYTFGSVYLAGGLSLIVIILGVFALPEFIDLMTGGKPIAREAQAGLKDSRVAGAREVFRHKWLMLRSSIIGILIGMVPGLGGSAVNWVVYASAMQTVKNAENFGKGDIRGVVAVESANNATEGGQLVPTLMFGIPGGSTAAILLGGLILLGIQPGPQLIQPTGLPTLLFVVWTLSFANIFATSICFGLAKPMSRLSYIPGRKLVPVLMVISIVAVYQFREAWTDVIFLFVFGIVAWFLKRNRWPRPPLLIGFILGTPAERYFGISMGRWGTEWLTDWLVLTMAAATIATVVAMVRRDRKLRATAAAKARAAAAGSDDVTASTQEGARDE